MHSTGTNTTDRLLAQLEAESLAKQQCLVADLLMAMAAWLQWSRVS